MDLLLDDHVMLAILELLPAETSLQVAAASPRLLGLARADIIWLKVGDSKWRFGSTAAASACAQPAPALGSSVPPTPLQAPGARDAAAEAARREASLEPLCKRINAFHFFLNRCQKDVDILRLIAKLAVLFRIRERGRGEQPDPLAGALVRIEGLTGASHLNGNFAIGLDVAEGAATGDDRFSVITYPALKCISVKRQNIVHLATLPEPMRSFAEVEADLMSVGCQGIDVVSRLSEQAKRKALGHQELEYIAKRTLARLMETWAVQQWEQLLQDESRCNLLEEGGLVLSQWAEPGVADVARARGILSELTEAVKAKLSADSTIQDRIKAVCTVMFDEYKFQGDSSNYYNPLNSCLHSVLERRRGIPISLSVVWVAVATRAGIPCYVCASMPCHIIIRVTIGHRPEHDTYIDAFSCQIMTLPLLQVFVRNLGIPTFNESFVAQRPASAVYSRMLRNLINIYEGSQLELFAGAISQSIAIADPSAAAEMANLRNVREKLRLTRLGW